MAFGRDQLLRWLSPSVVQQCGAIPYRWSDDGLQVLLVTSGAGRWIVPKGWPKLFRPAFEAAALEAFEEAGVRGVVDPSPIGIFDHFKSIGRNRAVLCRVTTFSLDVEIELAEWPEHGRRKRRWVDLLEARTLVNNPSLSKLMARLGEAVRADRSNQLVPGPAARG